ncbi:protein phosphatase 1 regulatory subunit 3G [Rhinatrema bivittatum]|uniref:protein phosphatase 1 regulatory subunit 3G n=1 Tax=Rhinatrema bivittatum TaxID=194408 RepID=UPI0011299803|nr:protein phosphatase 1 regulatory subunit 3G [Rhinatrema bivittatum]
MESQEDPSAGCSLSQPPRLDAYLGALTLSGEVEDNDDEEEEEEELGEAAAALQRWASRLDQQRLSRQSSEAAAATASRLHVCDEEEEEEEDDDDEVRQHRRRAVSLPANPSQAAASLFHPFPGGGAGVEGCCKCKKRVQFADALGLSLASVRHFSASEEPRVPAAVLSRLRSFPACQRDLDELLLMGGGDATMLTPPPPAFLEPDFLVPGGEELEARLRRDRVCLEAVSAQHFDVRGRVRILPLRGDPGEEEKEDESSAEVSVRYTFNEWLSYLDAPADREEEELLAGASRFRFTLCAPPCLDPGARLYFAVCYRAAPGREFWDNNEGRNYALQYLPPGHLSAASTPFPAEEMH